VTLNDLEWLEWPFYVIYVHYYELPLTNYLLLIYCSLFITRVTNACDGFCDQRRSAGSGVYSEMGLGELGLGEMGLGEMGGHRILCVR